MENPRHGGAGWAAVYGGRTESDTTEVTAAEEDVNGLVSPPDRELRFVLS